MIGRKIEVGIGKEASRGTKVTPSFWVPKYEVNIQDKKKYIDNEQSIGVIADTDGSAIVQEWAEGDITGKIASDNFGLFLLATLGNSFSTDKETTVKDHTFELLNSNQHQSLTIECKNDNEQLAYALGVINALKITADVGKFVEFSASFFAKKGVASSSTPAYSSENEFIAKNASVKFADTLSGLDSASSTPMKSVELSIEKNIEPEDVLGSNEPLNYFNKQTSIEINIESLYTDTTLEAYFKNGTSKAMRIDIINSDVTIGASSNPALRIDLPKVSFPDWALSGANDELVAQTLKLKAHYSQSDSKFITAILTNETYSY